MRSVRSASSASLREFFDRFREDLAGKVSGENCGVIFRRRRPGSAASKLVWS